MKLFALLALILVGPVSIAQLKVTKLTKADIPVNIKFTGHVKEVLKYTDSDGEHLVFTTETGIVKAKGAAGDDGMRFGEVHAFNYKMDGGQLTLAWQIKDFSGECGEDVTANFLPGTFAVTDLNNDGKGEVWLMYRVTCRGDVSPAIQKIIMYEGAKKYAVRGTAKILVDGRTNHYLGGTYAFDEAFKSAPDAFKNYATELWKKNLEEKFN